MTVRPGWITPMLQVADIARSLAWWRHLGFETIDAARGGDGRIVWARAHCEGGALMFVPLEGSGPPAPGQRVPFYMYVADLESLRAQLRSAGIDPGRVSHPPYMRKGEICLTDPDGYTVFVGHWDAEEHEAWEREVQRKREAGILS
jgi:hypothetical protein